MRRFFLPTFADLFGISLMVTVVRVGSSRLFGDADPATHVATGRWILEHGAIPKTDPFSATHAGGEWFAHEWLAGLGFALAHDAVGWQGLVVFSALVLVLAHVFLYRFLVRRGDGVLISFIAVNGAAWVSSAHWLARPHLWTILFLVLWVAILESVTQGRLRPRWLAVLPPLAALWANLHGGFLIALGTLACYGAGTLLRARPWPGSGRAAAPDRSRARALLIPLTATSAASAVAVLINPWGWRLPWHLLNFSTVASQARADIDEWAAPTIADRAGVALVAFLALCLIGLCSGAAVMILRRGRRRGDRQGGDARAETSGQEAGPFNPGTVLAFAMTGFMALTSIRHAELVAVFGAIIIADGLSSLVRFKMEATIAADMERLRRYEAHHGGALLLLAVVVLIGLAGTDSLPRAGFDPDRYPVAAIDKLKEAAIVPKGPVLMSSPTGSCFAGRRSARFTRRVSQRAITISLLLLNRSASSAGRASSVPKRL